MEQVEHGDLRGPDTIELIQKYLGPLLARGTDTIVLGCTHYNFLQETIREVVGPSTTLFESAAAVARQTARVLPARDAQVLHEAAAVPAPLMFFTSGDPATVQRVVEQLWGEPVPELQQLAV